MLRKWFGARIASGWWNSQEKILGNLVVMDDVIIQLDLWESSIMKATVPIQKGKLMIYEHEDCGKYQDCNYRIDVGWCPIICL